MGTDHFRIISSSTTMNISNVYQKLNMYLMFIDDYLVKENQSFAFHSKFAFLTSSIRELSGLNIIIHCVILNEYHQKLFETAQEHLCYSINPFDPSTITITNRPSLGLNDHEKLLRTIYATLILLHNNQKTV
jgi:protein-arginine kinase